MSACLPTAPAVWTRRDRAGATPGRWLAVLAGLWRELERRGRLRRMPDLDDRLLDGAGESP